jgi:hypothetical protein
LTFFRASDPWKKLLKEHRLLGEPEKNGQHPEFSHVIQLEMDDEEIRERAKYMLLDPTDGVVYSRWEMDERNKPKPKQFDEDGNEIEAEEPDPEDENYLKPLLKNQLVQRVEDTDEYIQTHLVNYNAFEKKDLEEFAVNLFNHQYFRLEVAGLTPDEIAESVEQTIRIDATVPLRPIAKQLEGGSDFKGLLTDPLFEEQPEGVLARQWSLWKQTDPVALLNKKVVQGTPENAVAYGDNMFVFENEENMQMFITDPKKFLVEPPKMPFT